MPKVCLIPQKNPISNGNSLFIFFDLREQKRERGTQNPPAGVLRPMTCKIIEGPEGLHRVD